MTLEQREQLIYGGILRQLEQKLKWSHKISPIDARPVQDAVCDVFNLLVEGIKNTPFSLISSHILKELVKFIEEDLPAEEVKLIHLQGIHHLIENDSLNYQDIFNIGVDKSVAKVLKSADQEVVETAVNTEAEILQVESYSDAFLFLDPTGTRFASGPARLSIQQFPFHLFAGLCVLTPLPREGNAVAKGGRGQHALLQVVFHNLTFHFGLCHPPYIRRADLFIAHIHFRPCQNPPLGGKSTG
ncbi:MAG: hypothetical protein EZS28_012712 [Streblomastix strix]|uniref:Uncharacterized protein n=1 Tax=Streblomastix strix TaxID=222440 RepID=A0A5J4WBL9_9EUKA|nr:MAG: hypothetical protein EZS28_012712 [Streblomastix strix]